MIFTRPSNSLLWALVFLFFLVSSVMLNRPYFWDEAWSYLPAIQEMSVHTPCLSPGCIDPELYRGHPLLFYFLSSAWMKWVDPSPFSMHLLALLIAALALVSLYKLSWAVLPKQYAALSVPLLILQEVFFVQSTFVLPEVLLMLLLTQTVRYFMLKKYFPFFIYGSLMGLTKETGLILLIPFMIISFFDKTQPFIRTFPVYASALPALLFYVVQKLTFGWFFYPLHIDLVDFSIPLFVQKLSMIVKFTFFEQGRIILLLTLLLALLIPSFKRDPKKHLRFIVPGLVVMILVFILHKLAFTLLVLFITGIVFRTKHALNKTERAFVFISLVMVIIVFLFSAFNFLMTRYLLVVFPLLLVLWLFALTKAIGLNLRNIIAVSSAVCLFLIFSMVHNYTRKGWHDDASINYINAIKSHQAAIGFCEQKEWTGKNISTHFLMHQYLTLPALGYLSGSETFKLARYQGEIPPENELIIFSCIELDEYRYEFIKTHPNYKLVYRNQLHQAWTEIYSKELQAESIIIKL